MTVKKGDFVLNWSDGEPEIHIGKVMTDPDDGEFDLEFLDGGSVSPAYECSAVIPEAVARFLDGAINLLPIDPSTGDTDLSPVDAVQKRGVPWYGWGDSPDSKD